MSKLSKGELKTSFALSSVVGLRMFGLFLIMPVFSAYALHLPGATPLEREMAKRAKGDSHKRVG